MVYGGSYVEVCGRSEVSLLVSQIGQEDCYAPRRIYLSSRCTVAFVRGAALSARAATGG